MDLFFAQHAEKRSAPDDPQLTPRGQSQAKAVATHLRQLPIEAVYSSPLKRALETAATIAELCAVDVVTDAELTERMNWTRNCGLSLSEFMDEWRRATADRSYTPVVGESSTDAGARLAGWIRSAATRHRGTVVCVTHGGVTIDLFRTLIGDAELQHRAPGLIDAGVPPGAISHIKVVGEDVEVIDIANLQHLVDC